jgi:Flp pilus assembly protein TadG
MRLRSKRQRKGAATVELAVLMPLLVYLFMITVDYGRIFYFSLALTNCARAGAFYAGDPLASSQSCYASVQDAALAEATNLNPPPVVTQTNGSDAAGNPYADVTATWTFRTINNYPGVPNTTNLVRRVRTRIAPNAPN